MTITYGHDDNTRGESKGSAPCAIRDRGAYPTRDCGDEARAADRKDCTTHGYAAFAEVTRSHHGRHPRPNRRTVVGTVILLDTHVLVWLAIDDRKLSKAAKRALRAPRAMADISLREIAALTRAGRIEVDGDLSDWLSDALRTHEIEIIPIDVAIAARSVRIAEHFHGDPADQLIAATAIELDVALITADERLRSASAVRTIW